MSILRKVGKDHLGAVLLIALGAGVLVTGFGYRMGDLNRMGAGYIPVALGTLMVLVGAIIGLTARPAGTEKPSAALHGAAHSRPEWRGWLCILGGVIAFVVLGQYGGLVPATFASVFISAMGDKDSKVKTSALLAAVLVVFCVLVFHYGLSMQLPLFQWG
jgi:hypothetical protein